MGIRGLTTFIQNRSHLYMEKYELHDTNLVIDGNSIACQLYRWHCRSNDCFGGDYDSFGQLVTNFFHMLFDCKIIPYLVFDGGYENRKIATVISRMKNKISSALILDTVTEGSVSVFPLFLRDVFHEIVRKMNISTVRCDFESDTETASIARSLNCPVLSYDSDYFILDVLYIPFNTFEMKVKQHKDSKTQTNYKYVPCEVYRVEKFLNSFGGLDKRNLPLLAVLLGNDYVKRRIFALFFQNLKIQRGQKGQSEQQKRIKSVIVWLQNETIESAIRKVLGRYKQCNRQKLCDKIKNAMDGYFQVNSQYLEYLGITPSTDVDRSDILDFSQFSSDNVDVATGEGNMNEDESEDSTDSSSEKDSQANVSLVLNVKDPCTADIPKLFLENFRKCVYPPCFMDIIKRGQYYSIPQVEHPDLEHAHTVSIEILSAIQKMLTNSTNSLVCICRVSRHVGRQKIPLYSLEVPLYSDIFNMNLEGRQALLFKILNINKNFRDVCLISFPKSWHLFIVSLKYSTDKSFLSWPLIFSLLLGKIVLEHLDKKIGYCRNKKQLDKLNVELPKESLDNANGNNKNILDALINISYSDSVQAIECFLSYFHIGEKMRTHRGSFDRHLVHCISQFQSVLLHVRYLNLLLNFPFEDIFISETLNCTFVYNFTANLKKRTDCRCYIELLLKKCPTVFNSFSLVESKLREYVVQSVKTHEGNPKRRRKKRKSTNMHVNDNVEVNFEEEEDLLDHNNKFSLLSMN